VNTGTCARFLPEVKRIFGTQWLSGFCLLQDRDPTHNVDKGDIDRWNVSGEFHVDSLEMWPGNSPDLNPIENVWAAGYTRHMRTRAI
jgi:hypothetical protein